MKCPLVGQELDNVLDVWRGALRTEPLGWGKIGEGSGFRH